MSCPTCGHTMHGIGTGLFWCPRCGTLTGVNADGSACVPMLVERCRNFEDILATSVDAAQKWHATGVAESINIPGNRMGD